MKGWLRPISISCQYCSNTNTRSHHYNLQHHCYQHALHLLGGRIGGKKKKKIGISLVHVNIIHSSTVDSFNSYAQGTLREWEWRNATHYTRKSIRIKYRWSGAGSQKKHSNIWHIIKSIKIGYKCKSINPISRNCIKYFAFAELSVCQKLQNSNILKVSN